MKFDNKKQREAMAAMLYKLADDVAAGTILIEQLNMGAGYARYAEPGAVMWEHQHTGVQRLEFTLITRDVAATERFNEKLSRLSAWGTMLEVTEP